MTPFIGNNIYESFVTLGTKTISADCNYHAWNKVMWRSSKCQLSLFWDLMSDQTRFYVLRSAYETIIGYHCQNYVYRWYHARYCSVKIFPQWSSTLQPLILPRLPIVCMYLLVFTALPPGFRPYTYLVGRTTVSKSIAFSPGRYLESALGKSLQKRENCSKLFSLS